MKLLLSFLALFCTNGACIMDPSVSEVLEPYQYLNPEEIDPAHIDMMKARISDMMGQRALTPRQPGKISYWYLDRPFAGCGHQNAIVYGCTLTYDSKQIVLVARSNVENCPDMNSLGHELVHVLADEYDYGDHANPLLFNAKDSITVQNDQIDMKECLQKRRELNAK